MRTRFADAAQHADAYFVIRAISTSYIRSEDYGQRKRAKLIRLSKEQNRSLREICPIFLTFAILTDLLSSKFDEQ